MEYIAKNNFSQESFFMNFRVVLVLFGAFGAVFFSFLCLGNKLKFRMICNERTDLEPGIWRGGSTGYSDPKSNLKA